MKKITLDSILGFKKTDNLSEEERRRKIGIHNMLLQYVKAGFFKE